MKKLTTLILLLLCAATLFAQAPEKFSYQAVVRNASNALVSNTQVGVRVSILQGTASGNAVYVETHTTTTNTNGLLTLEIGGGSVQQGTLADIDWSDGPYFMKTDIDPNGGNDYSITSLQQMMSVPYALYAKEAANSFSGDYNDLTNQPLIPTVPTNVSVFTNDAGYLTSFTEQQVLSISHDTLFLTGGSFVKLPAGFDGDYNSLTNKPVIPTVPTNVSAFSNDAGYITMDSVPAIPTNVSAFTNDAGYLTSFTEEQVLTISNDTLFLTGGSFVKLPAGFDGDYNSLTNKPGLFSGDYNDLENLPQIPQIPADISAFNNDVGYITMDSVPTIPTNVSAFTNDAGYLTGSDIPEIPEIPEVPTNVSAFNNDAGYITAAQMPASMTGTQTGDIMYWDAATSTWIMMPAGSAGQVLTMENGVPVWANLPDHITMNLPPTVTTSAPSEVTQSSALCGGEVTSDGSVQLTACGVCWSTHHFPTIADMHTENELSVSAFTSHVTGLAHQTTYYVRAYASNSIGTTYGAEMTFTTADIPSDSVTMPDPCSSDTNATWHPILGNGSTLCAGTDSVELTLNNYQYGSIQWQYSTDTVSWFDIPGAIDTLLVYKPEQTQFVRAEVSYANCPPEYSAVKLLQKTPSAYAGISRTVNIGDTLHLQANMEEGATGGWQILQGTNGFLADPTDATSKFYGTDSLYRLRWTLTNSCGSSSDDINVRYVQTVMSSKVVVVDTTDIIFSDSVQMANGYYVISFSDPNIVIGDSTILVSLINGGFLRMVDSWSMANDSTYAMYTSQATLYDMLESGVINLGGTSDVSEVDTTVQYEQPAPEMRFMDHVPTRNEVREHPEMNGKLYVLGIELYGEDGDGENLMPVPLTRGGTNSGVSDNYYNGPISFNIPIYSRNGISLENATITINPATPVLDYTANTRTLNFGFCNTQLDINADLVFNGVSSLPEFSLPSKNATIKTVYYYNDIPISCYLKCSLNFQIDGSVSITGNIRHKLTASANFSWNRNFALNDWNPSVPKPDEKYNYGYTNIELISDYSPITADLSLSMGVCQDFILYGVEGPHTEVGCMATMKYLNHSMGCQGILSSDLYVNADLTGAYKVIDDGILENWSDHFSSSKNSGDKWYSFSTRKRYPYKMQTTNASQYQTIQAGGQVVSVEVKVLGSDNKPMKNINVYFEPQDGGQVSPSMVTTNQIGVAQTQWTTGEAVTLTHQLKAYVYDGTGQPIENSPLVFTAYEGVSQPQAHNCANSTLQLVIKDGAFKRGGPLYLVPQNGVSPYTFSMDWHNVGNIGTGTAALSLDNLAPGNHEFMVSDANGCVATKSYKVEGLIDCSLSDLRLNERVEGNQITLTGLNGKSPYTYSLDGKPYSETNVFPSLSPGIHTASVMDINLCVKSMEITINASSSASQGATSCASTPIVMDIDDNIYHTLQIGNQCWMAENLRTTRYADGSDIPEEASFYYPNNDKSEKHKKGLLYTWYAATGGQSSGTNPSGVQGACPTGWHIPSDAEWTELLSLPTLQVCPARALASKEGWNTYTTPSCCPGYESFRNNGQHFNATPAGYNDNGVSYDFGAVAWFWSATRDTSYSDSAWGRYLSYNRTLVGSNSDGSFNYYYKESRAFSVRCLRD